VGSVSPSGSRTSKALGKDDTVRIQTLAVIAILVSLISGAIVFSDSVPEKPRDVIAWVKAAWTEDGSDASLKKKYMRLSDDTGWHRRMIGMQALVRSGAESVSPLLAVLKSGDPGMRIFAAQTLSYLGPSVEHADLVAALADKETAVRLYAVDALGMSGLTGLSALLEPTQTDDENRDVKKHIDYALLREGAAVSGDVTAKMLAWDPKTIDSAVVGEMAPDFELTAVTGETIRLSDFSGKKAVVIVFVYGDT
jgi:hypothetical protein